MADVHHGADVNRGDRPLSPHIMIYSPQMTSMSSIVVRITGIAMLAGAFLAVCWLVAAATSEPAFNFMNGLLTSFVGDVIMFLLCWAVWYNMLGRLRHVIWDFGYCLDVETSEKMGWGLFIGATVLALLTAVLV